MTPPVAKSQNDGRRRPIGSNRKSGGMMLRSTIGTAVVLLAMSAISSATAAEKAQLKAAAEKSIALLQRSGPEFFRKSGCVACHHQTVTALAVSEARKRGVNVDEKTAREQVQISALTVKSYQTRFLQRVDHPANSAPSSGYTLLGLAAENYPPDESTDAMVIEMSGRQAVDGSWTAFGHRPPLEYSRIAATALAVRAMQLYGPPGLKEKIDGRIDRARAWLVAAEPAVNAEHAFRLLGLTWAGADRPQIVRQTARLVEQQRDDGGWAQLPDLASDAYATGLTLYALQNGGGLAPSDAAYERGVAFLLQTQRDDGSWFVKTRAFPFQPYFESGFPYGPDQWISATATGFAAVAVMYALPPGAAASP